MPEKVKEEVNIELEAVANIKNFTNIPNSNSEFCIYTYKAEYESTMQIIRDGFFDPAYSFLNVGDTIRVFRFDTEKNLTNYMEQIVMYVDKINRKVTVVTLSNTNLQNKLAK